MPDESLIDPFEHYHRNLTRSLFLVVVKNPHLVGLKFEEPIAFFAAGNPRPRLKALAPHFNRHRRVGDQINEPRRIVG